MLIALLVTFAAVSTVSAQQAQPGRRAPRLPDNIEMKKVDIWSEGTRMSGDLFMPKDATAENKYPAIVMSHGWGGTRAHLSSTYAPRFASEGFVVLSFDYRGWGDSDSKLVIKGEMPKPNEKGEVTVTAQAIRESVDPFDQTIDIMNAIDFIEGQPEVDASRIGLWGTSYSGGHVVYVAAHDPRVKAIVSQVSAQNSTEIVDRIWKEQGGIEYAKKQAIQRARGEIDPIPQNNQDKAPNLGGTPFLSKIVEYRPVDYADQVKAATLLIDAEGEELFDIKDHSGKVAEIMKANNVPVKYVIVEDITHYGIYTQKFAEGAQLAVDWFKEHLKKSE